MTYQYKTQGVCARGVSFDIDNGTVHNVQFYGGCSGNTQGVGALCENRPAAEVAGILSGIRCGAKPTSCPDQLSRAIREALAQN